MIIWLASYPKSGNTWVRIFLSSLFSTNNDVNINNLMIKQFPLRYNFENLTNNVNDVNEFVKNSIHAQTKINIDNKVKILKTHNAYWRSGDYYFTDTSNTLGCIYIVRDPRNVFTSIKNHFSYDDQKAMEMILDKKSYIMAKDGGGFASYSYVSSWAQNYVSWLNYNKIRRLFVRYEDLLENKYETFRDIIVFINTLTNRIEGVNKSKLQNAIETTNFNILKSKETDVSLGKTDNGFKKWKSLCQKQKR